MIILLLSDYVRDNTSVYISQRQQYNNTHTHVYTWITFIIMFD